MLLLWRAILTHLVLFAFLCPQSLETWVQQPRCHSAVRACLKIQRGPSVRLLALASVGSARAARCGDAQASPPWQPPKSAAADPLSIFIQALIHFPDLVVSAGNPRTSVALSGSPLHRFASSPICGYQRFPWARYSAIHLRLRVVFS